MYVGIVILYLDFAAFDSTACTIFPATLLAGSLKLSSISPPLTLFQNNLYKNY